MKKKTNNVDTRLWVFKNIKKIFKYYFKNIIYIFVLNFLSFLIINNFLKYKYSALVYTFFNNPTIFKIVYYGSFLLLFYTIKVIFYGNAVYIMKTDGTNDLSDLLRTIFKRFLPTLGTFIIYIISLLFLSLLLVIPGIIFFFYYYFAVFLCAVGDINTKENNQIKLLNGGKALARSFVLVKNNLIRFIIMSIIVVAIIWLLQIIFLKILIIFNLTSLNNTIINTIKFSIYDIIVIYSVLIFVKLEGIENDVLEQEFRNDAEDQAKMNAVRINNFGKSKK